MPDFTSILDKNFSAARFPDEPLVLTIKDVTVEEVGQDKEAKPVLKFIEDKRGLVLNGGRYDSLALATGTRNTDTWPGLKVRLTKNPNVTYKGKKVGGIDLEVVK